MGAKSIILQPIPSPIARKVIVKNHYSHSFPASLINFGIYDGKVLKGVICFGRGANMNVVKYLGTRNYLELTRLWIDDCLGKNTESRAISVAIRLIKKRYPFIEKIISYADKEQGHEGIIYKATGFIHMGIQNTENGLIINGKHYHRRSITAKYGCSQIEYLKRLLKTEHIKKAGGKGKHRYLLNLR